MTRGQRERRDVIRLLILTLAFAIPLLTSLITTHQYYPVVTWKLFAGRHELGAPFRYYVLEGVTADGDTIPVRATDVVNPLSTGIRQLVEAVVDNASFAPDPARGALWSPHPENIHLLDRAGGVEALPRAARVPDLLRGFGRAYNRSLTPDAPERLRTLVLREMVWPGEGYHDYAVPADVWRVAVE